VVIKIVPFDGETPVNGEIQKRSAEITAEIAVSLTLSQLRGTPGGFRFNILSHAHHVHGARMSVGH